MTSKTLFRKLALAGCTLIAATQIGRAQTPLYQWNFNGASGTGVPSITAGGGILSTAIGAGSFTGAGLTGAGTDFTYNGTSASDGYRTAADISSLGTISNLTVTFWINPLVAFAGQQASARLLMLGNATTYDESAGNGSPGFSLALAASTGLQYNINNGTQPAQAGVFTGYPAGQWIFVAVEYDGLGTPTSSTALGTAIGNGSGNYAIMTGTTTASIGAPTMENLTKTGGLSPGPITNTASMALLVGNRNSGARGFAGQIDNINIFTNLLTLSQVESLRISSYATSLTAGLLTSAASPVVRGIKVVLTAAAALGTAPYTYQWQTDGGGNGGTLTNIPGATFTTLTNDTTGFALGNYQYQVVVTDSTPTPVTSSPYTMNVIIQIPGTLTDNSNTVPAAASSDAAQLVEASGFIAASGLNYYTDNGFVNNLFAGQTFTTGNNPKGYSMNSVAIGLGGGSTGGITQLVRYDLLVYSISADLTTATLIADITNLSYSFTNYPTWLNWSFAPIVLTNNATYAYGFGRRTSAASSDYAGLATSPGSSDLYAGGQVCAIPSGGGTVTYGGATQDAAFDVGLIPNGVPFLLSAPTAAPNPVYALTSVALGCHPTTPGIYTYHWFTDDGTGATPPNMISIPGATATNLTMIPRDLNPGGADYTTNYYFVATDTTSGNSVTSSVVALTVHAASIPQFSAIPNPTNLVTFTGNTVVYSVTEFGTLPITNQWQLNTGSGYNGLTGKTNTTLILNNVQTTDSGSYQIVATNLIGRTNTDPVTLTVLPAPAAPIAASQKYFNTVYTNHPWAYWRLNETNDPTAVDAPTYRAYDYSGHNFDPTYGNAVTVSNAGPQLPAFSGFDANELAAGTVLSTANSYLTVPPLNLAGNTNITFLAWINPNGPQAGAAGLLFNRGGPDNACGFGFGNTSDHLGYTWNNNNANTYNWDSTLVVAEGEWNFVAYVITPTNATVYLGNLSGGTTNFLQAVNPIGHIGETFAGGTLLLGGDSLGIGRNFNGLMTEASLFTNAMSSAQVLQYFLTGIGASGLLPIVSSTTVTPTEATGGGVYSGQNVVLSASVNSLPPLGIQWQSSPDGSAWANVPGATAASVVINPFTVGTTYYQLVATNTTGATTNATVTVTFNALPAHPVGLWTVNFEYTNNITGPSQTVSGGLGSYIGRGILGNGMFWNPVPDIRTAGTVYNGSTVFSTSGLTDDGVNNSGISCEFWNGGTYNGIGTLGSPYNPMNLTEQWFRSYYDHPELSVPGNDFYTLQLTNVPAGTYNVVCYGGAGRTTQGSQNFGSKFVVQDSLNGDQTSFTACPSPVTSLQEGVNFVLFTNVHASGTLNISVQTNSVTETDVYGTVSAVQLQLVSYDPPVAAFSGAPTHVFVTQPVTFTNNSTGSTNWVWNFGDGNTFSTSGHTNVSHAYASAGSYSVSLTANGPAGVNSVTNTAYIVVSPKPTIGSAKLSGGSFILSGANEPAGVQYRILTSTNVALPLANWTPVWTNVFAPDGTYGYTNSSPTNAESFFRLVSP